MKKTVILLFCLFLLVGECLADDLFVNNKPFQGQTEGSGSSLYVELSPLADMLGLELRESGPDVFLDDSPIRTKSVDGQTFVLLSSLAEAAGLKVVKNAGLGVVDVYKGQPKQVSSHSPSATSSTGASTGQGPTAAVMKYFATIGQLSKQYDFTSPDHFDAYLDAHRSVICQKAYDEHAPLIMQMKSDGTMGDFFDGMLTDLGAARVKILDETVNGDRATVKATVTLPGNTNFSGSSDVTNFECYREGGVWKIDPQY
jgi:hypothetical protein